MAKQPSESLKSILLVDDEDGCRLTTKWFLSSLGYRVDSARSAEEALALFDLQKHDLVVTDNRMPGLTGNEMARAIKTRSPSTPVLMCTAAPPDERSCLDLVMVKPVHLLRLAEAIASLCAGNR